MKEVCCLALVGPATHSQKLPRDCRGAAPGVPLMLTAQEHVIDELDSITSLSLSRDSRCAKLLSECSRTARHARASTTRELRLSMSCACAHRTCACVHTLASSALIGFDVAMLPGTCSLTQRLKAFTLGTWQPSSLSTGEPARSRVSSRARAAHAVHALWSSCGRYQGQKQGRFVIRSVFGGCAAARACARTTAERGGVGWGGGEGSTL